MESARNHRIVVPRRGPADVLEVLEEPLPEPGPGEARVKVAAAGVSAYDLMIRAFWFPGNPRPPFTPGEDVVGVVDAIGRGASGVEPGQTVAAWTFGDGGGYTEYICRPAGQLVAVPDELEPAVAVTLVANYLTAHLYLNRTASVEPGELILVHGAAGGLGTALLQLGGLADLEMYGTASSHNHELVAGLGATPIDYRSEDFVERIMALTGDGVDAVFDTVSGVRQLRRSYRCVREGGRLVPIGSVATTKGGIKVIPLSLLTIGALKLRPDGRTVPLSPNMMKFPQANPDWYRQTLTEILGLAAEGSIQPVIAAQIPLLDAAEAHAQLARGGHAGKVVLIA